MIGKVLALLALLTLLPGLAALQARPSAQPFRGAVEVVKLDVAVTRGGRPVTDLTAADFAVFDNGAEQQVDAVRIDTMPLNVTLVLDTSGSMSGKRTRRAAEASTALAALLKPDERISVLTFSHTIALRVPMTDDFGTVARELAKVQPGGASAVRDAVHTAIQLVPNDQRRPLIILLSDGEDTSSWLNSEAALDSARRASVVIDAVTFAGSTFVNQVVEATGGRLWGAASEDHLRQLFAQALDEMRSRYLVTYTPTTPSTAGWHRVRVSLRRGRADISVRPGYFVTERSARPAATD